MAASALTPISISAPGFYGLNSQEGAVAVGENFALVADNAVIDTYGRIGARKGYNVFSDTDAADTVQCIHEHVNQDGTTELFFAGGNKFYSVDVDGVVTEEYTHAGSGVNGNWQAMSFNNDAYFFEEGQNPVVNDVGTGWATLNSYSTMPTGVTTAGVGL